MTARPIDEALVERDPEAVAQLVTRVLRAAHDTAAARDDPGAARAILDVALLFADELTARDPSFDRLGFVTAVTDPARRAARSAASGQPAASGASAARNSNRVPTLL